MLDVGAGPAPASASGDAMTVDMLAATFFWPEGTLLGSIPPHPDGAEAAPVPSAGHEAADWAAEAEGFWPAVLRHLWRPSGRRSTVVAP